MTEVTFLQAGILEAGQTCPCCQDIIEAGQAIGRCNRCGHVQHAECWEQAGRCCSYECADAAIPPEERGAVDMRISLDDVSRTEPLPVPSCMAQPQFAGKRKTSRLAIVALILAICGTVAFGFPGFAAVVLGIIAAGTITGRGRRKGAWIAALAIVIGALDIVGWSAFLVVKYLMPVSGRRAEIPTGPIGGDQIEAADLENVPPHIRRALQANVLLSCRSGLAASQGSGVVLGHRDGAVLIITNKHVINAGGKTSGTIDVTVADAIRATASVKWLAPEGVDIAVLLCPLLHAPPAHVGVRIAPKLSIGETVFAVGNPIGLGWSYSRGVVSAIRKQNYSGGLLQIIQTQTPLNPGNSGGGLYDSTGALVGINTLKTGLPTEGIGFAISVSELVAMLEKQAGLAIEKIHGGGLDNHMDKEQ